MYYQRQKTTEQRFLEKVDKNGPIHPTLGQCWQWIAARQPKGYGIFWIDGQRLTAHRASFKMFFEWDIPAGILIDHMCMNKSCVNPAHLRGVTNKVNISENSNHYAARTHCSQGHVLPNYQNENGRRRCRVCERERRRQIYQEKKASK